MREWLCVDESDDSIGYASAVYRDRPETPFTRASRWVELDQIVVRDDNRGHDAGRLLTASVVEWARELQVASLELSVWQFNSTAQIFFRGLGFEPHWQRQAWQLPET